MGEIAALGFRVHSGWAAAVAVAGTPELPVILSRRRIEIAELEIVGSRQPYHAAERLEIDGAERLICQCGDSSTALAVEAVSAMVGQLHRSQFSVVGVGILFASGRPLPDLTAILRSHALIHTAEGEFFRDVLIRASEQCSLPVTRVKEREIRDRAEKLGPLRKQIGPPWTQDQKLASMAALIALKADRDKMTGDHEP